MLSLTLRRFARSNLFSMKFSVLLSFLLVSVFAIGDDLAARVDAGWAQAMTTWNPRTGVVTGCDSRKSLPPPDATNTLYRMYKGRPGGWGPPGVGDAPLICGTALSGLVDKWAVTRDPAVKEEAAKVAICVASEATCVNPIPIKISSVMTMEGTVVSIM